MGSDLKIERAQRRAAALIAQKDAAILAAALEAKGDYLITLDKKTLS